MGTEILKSFGTLQSELEQAKNSLKGVDENIKRLIGRDPSEFPTRTNLKRGNLQNDERNRQQRLINRNRNFSIDTNDEPPNKRRINSNLSVFKRLSEKTSHYEDDTVQLPQKQMISKVIVTPKELPSRQEALAAQSKDEKSKQRNRRMFGALLGTLQKFQQEETRLKQKEEKRAQLEKKIEEHEIKEKEEIKKERQELFFNRKKKQAEIKMIELKMMRMKEYTSWEERQKPRMNFIQTKAKPHIHYLPRRINEKSKEMLETCKVDIEKMIDNKRQEVFDELQHIEERMKKNFEIRKSKNDEKENNEMNVDNDEEDRHLLNNNNNDNDMKDELVDDVLVSETTNNEELVNPTTVPDVTIQNAEENKNGNEIVEEKLTSNDDKDGDEQIHEEEASKHSSNCFVVDNDMVKDSTNDDVNNEKAKFV